MSLSSLDGLDKRSSSSAKLFSCCRRFSCFCCCACAPDSCRPPPRRRPCCPRVSIPWKKFVAKTSSVEALSRRQRNVYYLLRVAHQIWMMINVFWKNGKVPPFFFFVLSNEKAIFKRGLKCSTYHKGVLNRIREKFYAARGVVMVEFLFRTR